MKEIFEVLFPGLMLMWVGFIANGVFADIFVEYKANTIARLISSGVSIWAIILSKMLRCIVVCWICELLLILFTWVVFDVRWSSPWDTRPWIADTSASSKNTRSLRSSVAFAKGTSTSDNP